MRNGSSWAPNGKTVEKARATRRRDAMRFGKDEDFQLSVSMSVIFLSPVAEFITNVWNSVIAAKGGGGHDMKLEGML